MLYIVWLVFIFKYQGKSDRHYQSEPREDEPRRLPARYFCQSICLRINKVIYNSLSSKHTDSRPQSVGHHHKQPL